MKKTKKQKPLVIVEVTETIHNTAQFAKPALSFFGSFILIVCFVLSLNWYGKQLYFSVKTIFRAPLAIHLPVARFTSSTSSYDPLDLIEAVKKKKTDIIFLDIRSTEEYQKAHVKNAVSVPFYSYENDSIKYMDVQKNIDTIKIDKSKFIVIYGPSTSFQYQQTVLSHLKNRGYNAQLLAIGWNELRHFQNFWLPEPLWGKVDITSFTDEISD